VLFSLVYVSRAVAPFSRDDLLGLLRQARAHNEAARLTGILLYRDQTFVQLLEGQRHRVEALYDSIRRDHRHTGVTTVITRDQLDRQFPDWSMGFSNLDAEPLDEPGWNDVLDRRAAAAASTGEGERGPLVRTTDPEAELVRDLLDLFDATR
jgi:hypothetical protein